MFNDPWLAGVVFGAVAGWILGLFTPIIVNAITEALADRRTDEELLNDVWTFFDKRTTR